MLLVAIWKDEKCLPMIRTIWKKCFWIDSTNTVNLSRDGDEASKNFVLDTYKLREKESKYGVFLVRTFLYSD